jgi:CheY-like chemotaxis protein
LEEDGRLEVQITQEYSELNLSNPPSITRVASTIEALELINRCEQFDLVITMYNVGEMDVYTFSHKMKQICPKTPVVLLTNFSKEIYRQIEQADTSDLDYVFCWNNSTDLIIAIIKLIEDNMNADHDILEFGVQTILLVEDSIRYYSTYLPAIYKLVLQQNGASVRDALNEQQQIARKRARPKILMATNYDDAVKMYQRYKNNMLGVISDVGFVIHKGDDPATEKLDAGIDLILGHMAVVLTGKTATGAVTAVHGALVGDEEQHTVGIAVGQTGAGRIRILVEGIGILINSKVQLCGSGDGLLTDGIEGIVQVDQGQIIGGNGHAELTEGGGNALFLFLAKEKA